MQPPIGTFENRPIALSGLGELYGRRNGGAGAEIPRGRELENTAIAGYKTDELRPGDIPAYERLSRGQQVTQAYEHLRRAVVVLERPRIVSAYVPPVEAVPASTGGFEACPSDVESAARNNISPPVHPAFRGLVPGR
jgi:hypothetical protein